MYAIADVFVMSEEFQSRYPASLTNEEFVTALYESMLERAPDYEGLQYWVSQLDAGYSPGTVLANFTNSNENQDSNPLRKAALASFIEFIANDADGAITPEEAAAWLAANPGLDGALVDGALPNPTLLTVTKTGTGSGTVTSSPAGIDCGSACAADFAAGTTVTLTPIPATGSIFSGWGGDCGGTLCQMTMSENRSVTATFTLESGAGGSSEVPRRVDLVAATSLQGDRIQLDWLATFDNDTPSSDIRYRLHADQTANFVPTAATLYAEVIGDVSGTLTGLAPETPYYVKVEASDQYGNSSWSNELSVTTAASVPQESAVPRRILDAQTAPMQTVTTDQIRYSLPAGQIPPQSGDLLVSPSGDGYLRRAIAVSQSGGEVTVQTEPAALNEAFDDLQFSTDVRLIDLSQATSSAQAQTLSQGLRVQSNAQTRQITWPESGLTLIQVEPDAPLARAAQASVRTASNAIACSGASGARRTRYDVPLQVTFPEAVCVEPGSQLSIDISAEIQASDGDRYQVTQLQFLEMTHSEIVSTAENYGAVWSPNSSGSDTQGQGTLRWTPGERHVDGQLRPYTARFVALAKEREGHCTGLFGGYCQTKKIEFEVRIGVAWGDLPKPEPRRIVDGNAKLNIDGTVTVDFQPTIRAEADIQGGRLSYGQIAIQGPISFESQVRLQATAAASYTNSQKLIDRRFIKIFWVGQVPILINGHFTLNVEYRGEASAALNLTETLEMGYNIEAGLEYRDGQWNLLQKAQPWQRFELSGEANTRAYVELRFVPDLDLRFYEVATGRLIVEPYLYGEAALEGHFLYQLLGDGSGVNQGDDADYRFTTLEFGGGVDGKFRAGLEVFDQSIIGYPPNPNDFHEFKLRERTPIVGLPKLTPRETPACNPQNPSAVALTADVENLPNPFRPLFGGPETFNTFVDDSADWEVVSFNGQAALPAGITLTPGDHARNAWFSADQSGQYTLRFKGHSSFGSFIRQYEEIQVNFDPSTDHCGCGEGQIIQVNGVDRYKVVGSDCSIVADLVTGLEWQRCSVGLTWNVNIQWCDGPYPSSFTWDQAMTQTAPGGFRLPTLTELSSLVYCPNTGTIGVPVPPVAVGYSSCYGDEEWWGDYQHPTIVWEAFPRTIEEVPYWSSSASTETPRDAGIVWFRGSAFLEYLKDRTLPVRLVRGGQ